MLVTPPFIQSFWKEKREYDNRITSSRDAGLTVYWLALLKKLPVAFHPTAALSKADIKMTAVVLPGWKNHFTWSGALAVRESGFKRSQMICLGLGWRWAHATRESLMATNHFSQKSIKEPAKKHFPPNYITQIVPDSTHVFLAAVYLQHNDSGAWLKPFFPPEAWLGKEFSHITDVLP